MRITGGRFEFLTAHAEGAPDREVCERREGQSEFTEERLALGDVVITVRRYPKRYFVALRVAAGPDEAHVVESGGVLERTLHAEYDHRLALARAMVAADDLTGHGPLRERLNRAYAASSPGGLVTLYLLWESGRSGSHLLLGTFSRLDLAQAHRPGGWCEVEGTSSTWHRRAGKRARADRFWITTDTLDAPHMR